MIRTFRHRGLERFYLNGDGRGLEPGQLVRIRRLLGILDAAAAAETLERLPDMRLHTPKGATAGVWAISNSRLWQINFRFEDGDACDVTLVRYH
jgi:toxin HigB-1